MVVMWWDSGVAWCLCAPHQLACPSAFHQVVGVHPLSFMGRKLPSPPGCGLERMARLYSSLCALAILQHSDRLPFVLLGHSVGAGAATAVAHAIVQQLGGRGGHVVADAALRCGSFLGLVVSGENSPRVRRVAR